MSKSALRNLMIHLAIGLVIALVLIGLSLLAPSTPVQLPENNRMATIQSVKLKATTDYMRASSDATRAAIERNSYK